ncbi:hypothetical protein [Bradyrhizobium sp. USDA 4529]
MQVISAQVTAIFQRSGASFGTSTAATSATASGTMPNCTIDRATRARSRRALASNISSANAIAAPNSRIHTVPGMTPVSKADKVSAVKATRSPCGTKITRVTVKTRTSAVASRM